LEEGSQRIEQGEIPALSTLIMEYVDVGKAARWGVDCGLD